MEASSVGEHEFRPRRPGALWPWLKLASWIELGLFAGLLIVWLAPGLERPTFFFGLSHGIGFLLLALLVWIAIMRREAPFWLLAATVTPLGPVGSTIGIEVIERRGGRSEGDPQSADGDPPAADADSRPAALRS